MCHNEYLLLHDHIGLVTNRFILLSIIPCILRCITLHSVTFVVGMCYCVLCVLFILYHTMSVNVYIACCVHIQLLVVFDL